MSVNTLDVSYRWHNVSLKTSKMLLVTSSCISWSNRMNEQYALCGLNHAHTASYNRYEQIQSQATCTYLHIYMKPRHHLNQCSQDVSKAYRHELLRNSSSSSANFSLTEMDLKRHLLRSNYLLRTQNMKMGYILIMPVRRICVQNLLNLFDILMGIKGSYHIGDCILWFVDAVS